MDRPNPPSEPFPTTMNDDTSAILLDEPYGHGIEPYSRLSGRGRGCGRTKSQPSRRIIRNPHLPGTDDDLGLENATFKWNEVAEHVDKDSDNGKSKWTSFSYRIK